jgi:hypothetical protein
MTDLSLARIALLPMCGIIPDAVTKVRIEQKRSASLAVPAA